MNTNDLTTKVDNLEKYSNYLSENLDEVLKKEKKSKQEIFMVFYINIDGMSRNQVQESIGQLNELYGDDNFENYTVKTIMMPVKNQETKVEIINTELVNGDIIKSFKNLVDTLDNDKYRELIEKLWKKD